MPDRTEIPAISELLKLTGKTAIVTGGAAGVGFAISRRLAQSGACVFVADIDVEKANQTSKEFNYIGLNTFPIECDIGNEESVIQTFNEVFKKHCGIDILVNNAGIFPRKLLAEMSGAEFERVQTINLKGAYICSREAAKQMIERRTGGCIINIVSIDALHPSDEGMAAYDSSKAGLLMLTKSLARELGPHDIRVNAVAPGGILTEGFGHMVHTQSSEEGKRRLKSLMARLPLGRMGEPDEVACAVLFLASSMASYITGSDIIVDGGYLVS